MRELVVAWGAVLVVMCGVACSAEEDPGPHSGGRSGSGAGAGGESGTAGTSGTGGVGGTSGTSGTGGVTGDGDGDGDGMCTFDTSDPNRNKVTAGGLCARLAAIQCAGEACCCDNPGRDLAGCMTDLQSFCKTQLLFDDIAMKPMAGFDAAAAEAAFSQLETLAASCDATVAKFGESITGLRGMFKGTVEAGGDCRPPNFMTDDTISGAAGLVSCTNGATTACLPMLIGGWRCVERKGAGSPCFTDANCTDNLYCNGLPEDGGGDCTPRKAIGEKCDLPNHCETLICKQGTCAEQTVENAYCLTQL